MNATLANGMEFHFRRTETAPVAAMTVILDTGARDDSASLCGRTNLMARLIGKGSTTRSSAAMAEAFESLGISFGASAGQDFVTVSVQSLAEDFPRAVELFADALLRANFPWEEIDTERGRVSSEIRARDDRPPQLAMKHLRRLLFEPHAYARPVEGELATLGEITQVDLGTLHAAVAVAPRMIASVAGMLDADGVKSLLESAFPSATERPDRRVKADTTLPFRAARHVVERKVEQAFIALGHRLCGATDPDVPALVVASTILGGGMSSRLFAELRDRRGLAYAVGATCSFNAMHGSFVAYIGTKPESQKEAEGGLWGEVRRLREEPVPPEELVRAQNYIVGNYLRELETCRMQAARTASDVAFGLGSDHAARYPQLVRAVTPRDLLRVANRYFIDPSHSIVTPRADG